jgi:hypothetical protein
VEKFPPVSKKMKIIIKIQGVREKPAPGIIG